MRQPKKRVSRRAEKVLFRLDAKVPHPRELEQTVRKNSYFFLVGTFLTKANLALKDNRSFAQRRKACQEKLNFLLKCFALSTKISFGFTLIPSSRFLRFSGEIFLNMFLIFIVD